MQVTQIKIIGAKVGICIKKKIDVFVRLQRLKSDPDTFS
jgi:hypothetical protein